MLTYDVVTITVHPGKHPAALSLLERSLSAGAYPGQLLGCWYSDIGALNQILLIHAGVNEPARTDARAKIAQSRDPFGVGEHLAGMSMDTYISFPFIPAMQGGQYGPIYEVRTYAVKRDGLAPTMELWRKFLPARQAVSTLLAAMYSVSGTVTRFMHLWPYASLDERQRLRSKSVADGVWPPPGGPDHFISMQSDIFLPADFSPMK
jgi:hypothetical protein